MNDDKLKNLLSENSRVPKAPNDEWTNILNSIEKKSGDSKSSFHIGLKQLSFGVSSFAVVAFVLVSLINPVLSPKQKLDKSEVEAFLAVDSYFYEVEGEYSWVDSF